MSDSASLWSEVEAQREAIRRVEADLRQAIAQRKQLAPGGLFGIFRKPDPKQLAEAELLCEVLKVELQDRRTRLRGALEAAERSQLPSREPPLETTGADDVESATRTLRAYIRLADLLETLHGIAGQVGRSRENQRRSIRRHRRPSSLLPYEPTVATNVRRETVSWDTYLDEAELLADLVGLVLVLPRRHPAASRPPNAPPEPPDLAAARRAEILGDSREFGTALELSLHRIDRLKTQVIHARSAARERCPEAWTRALAASPFDPIAAVAPAGSAGGPTEQLVAHWTALRTLFRTLTALRQRRARTLEYLDPAGEWQRRAEAVVALDASVHQGLLPPRNQSGDLPLFVERLETEWPALDARFRELFEASDP